MDGSSRCLVAVAGVIATVGCGSPRPNGVAASAPDVPAAAAPIVVSPSVPSELNPPYVVGPPSTGGAPSATPEQAVAFAWNEFIALSWPAGPQQGQVGQRDAAASNCRLGDPACV